LISDTKLQLLKIWLKKLSSFNTGHVDQMDEWLPKGLTPFNTSPNGKLHMLVVNLGQLPSICFHAFESIANLTNLSWFLLLWWYFVNSKRLGFLNICFNFGINKKCLSTILGPKFHLGTNRDNPQTWQFSTTLCSLWNKMNHFHMNGWKCTLNPSFKLGFLPHNVT